MRQSDSAYLCSENAMLNLKLQFRFEEVDSFGSRPNGDGLKYIVCFPKALNHFQIRN